MKKCNRCLVEKELDEFFNDKQGSDGKYSICKPCKKNSTREWRSNNRKKYNSVAREWRKKNPVSIRGYNLKKKFGMSREDYEQMRIAQNGRCFICGAHESGERYKKLAIDHCHKTNRVRKLLCSNCNKGIGNLQESTMLLKKAMNYLKEHS